MVLDPTLFGPGLLDHNVLLLLAHLKITDRVAVVPATACVTVQLVSISVGAGKTAGVDVRRVEDRYSYRRHHTVCLKPTHTGLLNSPGTSGPHIHGIAQTPASLKPISRNRCH